MSRVMLIAAFDACRAIGKNGKIPWKIPGEQAWFRALTMGNTVIFGRRTFAEIGKPLDGREILVVSRTAAYADAHVKTVPTLAAAVAAAQTELVFLGGGAAIYREGLPLAEMLYLTEIAGDFHGDVFFPELPTGAFTCISQESVAGEIPYVRKIYKRLECTANGVPKERSLIP